ncbi:MAG: post-transcriptional regulator [Bacilli bacterium]|nr:post-transcriptional regulator [Bacilli bacterium]
MDFEFTNINELYNRVKPALTTRKRELLRQKIDYIKEEDIWNFLREKKWINSIGLDLNTMVNDIFDLDVMDIENYMKSKMSETERKKYFGNDEII